jgi:alkanesulfonate monooxygenase SsuD/methylene tetrahydromethanopterin reductase-like flavin-dependent oxidoreductase (luciferase family)
VLAKELASVDVASPGRLIFGVLTAWVQQKFQVAVVCFIGAPLDRRKGGCA